MGGLAVWLQSITWPLLSRALSSLGMGVVSYIGVTAALNAAFSAAKSSFSGMSIEVVQLVGLAGMFDFMSIVAGGVVSGVAFMTMRKLSLVTGR